MELHHIGIVVKELESAAARYCEMFHYELQGEVVLDPVQTVRVQFLKPRSHSSNLIELIEPIGEISRVSDFLKRGGGINHLCYKVAELDAEITRLRALGALVVHAPVPAPAFYGKAIAWLYTPDRELIELLEQ